MQNSWIGVLIVSSIAALVVAAASWAVWALRRGLVVVDVHGSSMEPTLQNGDRVLVSRRTTVGVRTGDIVVIERAAAACGNGPARPAARRGRLAQRDWAVKRAVAVAGDPVPASVAGAAGVAPGTAVPAGFLVVLGDNPERSADSRVWGYLPTERLLGVVRRRLGGG
jgi:signal peptidase I